MFDYGEDDGSAFLVMELVPGQPLSQLIADSAPLSAQTTAAILIQAATALEAAHRSGVVHRDVKPANILITPGGTVKLTDFGISRLIDTAPLTRTGQVLGTAQYLSPEQAMGQSATASSDIYALGVVGHEMLTGQVPFVAGSAVGTALAHINQPPPPLPDTVPAGIRDVILAALAKKPADRPATAASMAEALRMPDASFTSGAAATTVLAATVLPAAAGPAAPSTPASGAPAEIQAVPTSAPSARPQVMPALAAPAAAVPADRPDGQRHLGPAWLLGAAAALALLGAIAFALPGVVDSKAPVAKATSSSTPSQNATGRITSPAENTGTTAEVASAPTAPSRPAPHSRARGKARGHDTAKDGKQ